MPTKQAIHSDHAPRAIGPYAQAIRAGNTLWTSGQIPLDPSTGELVSGGIREQTTQVLQNLQAVLAAAGADLSHTVKTTVFLTDLAGFAEMNTVYTTFFAPEGATPPARSTVEIAALPRGARVEIELVAILPTDPPKTSNPE